MRTQRRPAKLVGLIMTTAAVLATQAGTGLTAAEARGQAPITDENLQALRRCESSGNYRASTGNGYYGAYQFSVRTWRSLGYGGLPSRAPAEVQDQAAIRLAQRDGWRAWPACSRRIGLR